MNIKRWTLACSMALFTATSAFALDPADSVELDGNAIKDTALDDWQNINLGVSSAAVATGVVSDLPPATIFWKGGSKDTEDVTQWWYKDGSVPDKDDLRNGYAAAYFLPKMGGGNDLVFYFGAERYANNGDAIMGFWFFQDQVGPDGNNRFTGEHKENDLFIVMEYPQGTNAQPFVQVMRWVNSGGDVDDNLQLLYSSGDAGSKCNTATDSGVACAITNDNQELAGVANGLWPYENKSGIPDAYPHESLFEGRLNVTQALLNAGVNEAPCFSSFLIETRSSRSETAQLKDFLGGQFPLCSIEVAKTCSASALTADNKFTIDYTISLTNSGVGSIGAGEVITIDDQPSDGAAFQLTPAVSSLTGGADGWAPNEVLQVSGQYVSDVNGGMNTVDAFVTFGSSSITADQYTTGCDSLSLSPAISVNKLCDLSLTQTGNLVAVQKDYSVDVCNTGDTPLDVILTDNKDLALNESFSLDFPKTCLIDVDCGAGYTCNAGGFCEDGDGFLEGNFGGSVCATRTGTYLPSELPVGSDGNLTNQASVSATSPVAAPGDIGSDSNPIQDSDSATCDLCPLPQPEE
ncbi:hypothetical protein [Kangiella koreensis]|uniref:DUF11 domain-containing protein n=1 Tax=Kangiella koreensis (strain DSM 16069 / JCM 12317 / KCTC 12182 / SW-125) TaxID=523791 RepID=C7R8R2_KANKD|nr:hypothetical protein [Kangiella koreensis]ACV25925.1 conserved hypothetical protein [Kangiella koreensis DSM 16069]